MTTPDKLDTVYEPQQVEPAIYTAWERSQAFAPDPAAAADQPAYCIVIPPPNVTGALHLGHALNNTLQDVLIRYHRMMGHSTLWQPGTDHAGIATQAVVEKRLKEHENTTRHEIGREKLVERIWQWKDQYETRILSQLKLMGCSCDWDRTRFTLDEGLSRAVRQQFFHLFRDGLIFRGKRLVNWDTQLQTAVSDDEVYYETVKGHFWHLKYPVIEPQAGEPVYVIIATTRPETMLGDTAVAVHPDPAGFFARQESELQQLLANGSAREKVEAKARLEKLSARRESHLPHLVTLGRMASAGRRLLLPLVEREIPLIADEWADPTKGSGCVKITPAHDPNDYEVGLRQNLPMINVLTADGRIARILEPDGSVNGHSHHYEGLAFATDGRQKVVVDMEARDLVAEIEDHEVELGHSDRSKLPIEPYLSNQWFLKMGDVAGGEPSLALHGGRQVAGLAQAAMDVVHDGSVQVFPSRYAKSYLDWLGEKRDWCISRQLWWGHRIAVWSIDGESSDPAAIQSALETANALGIECAVLAPDGILAGDRLPGTIPPDLTGTSWHLCPAAEPSDTEQAALTQAGWRQEDDVLDTWFSSALWPFSTLGWPDETTHLERFYPSSVLCTSRDIITNWVARMVMFGLYAKGDIPFDHVYIHPKILDGRGETMSKSKGNGVDPVDIIHTHGADALRYTMADMTTETQDIRMPVEYVCPHCQALVDQAAAIKTEEQNRKSRGEKLGGRLQPSDCHRVPCSGCGREFATQWADEAAKQELGVGRETSDKFDIGRNFCNKLWNATRFALMNIEGAKCEPLAVAELAPEDRWILALLSRTIRGYHSLLANYQFSASVKELREFFWDSLCDWYIELTKSRLAGDPQAMEARSAKQVLAFCLDQLLRLWHPTMPFITEHLWRKLGEIAPQRGLPGVADLSSESLLISAAFPPAAGYPDLEDDNIVKLFGEIQDVVRGVRDLRAQCGVSPKEPVTVTVVLPEADRAAFESQAHIVRSLSNVEALAVDPTASRPANAGSLTIKSLRVFVHNISDDQAERGRITKGLEGLEKQIKGKESKLGNEKFVANAKPEVVEAERGRLDDLLAEREALRSHLNELES